MLSNLLWWPWHGKHTPFIPPVVVDYFPMGDVTPADLQGRTGPPPRGFRKRIEDDEEDFIFLLTRL